ncbi:phosphoinositide phospholipase C Plc1 [Schizosaccharomyces cryophilus OY26]|uniref:Phosphoinositide phospholipase C n=1 Tax=Schizosaccharomyces cryophilus (strain OY26 / ATCC MYA-4695 / CBS 11777 / NBRC 106824 / NRRL Y48691) TaxID=653667 RepID=S9X087_SCHCR|nr:phosphoinositide phospholipase C Plc1 [Schizosaccharomyces cryophilus OY26]EPY50357.1 phosphoinositide phospholipase C Plc1 [Schizosaccharomyces cryophilus OY26]
MLFNQKIMDQQEIEIVRESPVPLERTSSSFQLNEQFVPSATTPNRSHSVNNPLSASNDGLEHTTCDKEASSSGTLKKRSNSFSSFLDAHSKTTVPYSETDRSPGLNWLSVKLNILFRSQRAPLRSLRKSSTSSNNSRSEGSSTQTFPSTSDIFDTKHLLATIVPESIQNGCFLFRVTKKKVRQRKVSLDPFTGYMILDKNTGKPYRKLCVDDIKEIRQGSESRNYREQFKISYENEKRWFTIVYTAEDKMKALHFISPTMDGLNQWVMALEGLKTYRLNEFITGSRFVTNHNVQTIKGDEQLDHPWEKLEKDETAELTFVDVQCMCQKLHLNASFEYLEQMFRKADTLRTGKLNFEGFQHFVSILKTRPEVKQIFYKYTDNSKEMSLDQFIFFLRDSQKSTINDDQIELVYSSFCKSHDSPMDLIEFTSYLSSPANAPLTSINQNMNRPLNEYIISSSHNTYLLGKQFAGESSIEGYIRSLQRGCKCIEIDCWDGPDGPVVCHGRTFTSIIRFNDVIDVIKKYAFVVSAYPVIISLEIHCCPEQQQQMACYMREAFGNYLLTEPLGIHEKVLPSPEQLLYKILIKVKCQATISASNTIDVFQGGVVDSSTDTTESSELESGERNLSNEPKKRKRKVIISELQQIAPYVRSLRFRNFSLPESKTYNHIFSFSERTIKRHGKTMFPRLSKHNTKYLCRVYPGPLRLGSTNLNPQFYWRMGVQMVALNWQTYDVGLQINDALFQADPPSGYLLKPEYQRTMEEKVKQSKQLDNSPRKMLLNIEILSGQQLRRAKELFNSETLCPFVQVQIHSMEETPFRWTSSVVHRNGFRPIWQESFRYESVTKDDVYSVIRFLVHHRGSSGNDSVIAVFACPLYRLQTGYRHIPLYDMQGESLLFSTLFVRIEKTEF